jgi:putative resolvase
MYRENMYKTGKAARLLGVSFLTVKRWIYSGKLSAQKSVAGRYYISESEIRRILGKTPHNETRRCVIYARVSSHEQKPHLKTQVERLRKHAETEGYEVVKVLEEVASGLNENRRKLQTAYNLLKSEQANLLLVEFKDRLSRFGFNYLKTLAESYGASVEVMNGDIKKDAMQELVEDMISIVTIFSAKLYGLRSRKFKTITQAVKSAAKAS